MHKFTKLLNFSLSHFTFVPKTISIIRLPLIWKCEMIVYFAFVTAQKTQQIPQKIINAKRGVMA